MSARRPRLPAQRRALSTPASQSSLDFPTGCDAFALALELSDSHGLSVQLAWWMKMDIRRAPSSPMQRVRLKHMLVQGLPQAIFGSWMTSFRRKIMSLRPSAVLKKFPTVITMTPTPMNTPTSFKNVVQWPALRNRFWKHSLGPAELSSSCSSLAGNARPEQNREKNKNKK